MTALDTLFNITENQHLLKYNFKYCLVDEIKHPHKFDGSLARPNVNEDFASIEDLTDVSINTLTDYHCLGVSIQASQVCAIDLDDCVIKEFDETTITSKAKSIINLFKEFAYIEFSFSGHGIRIFFKSKPIDNYKYIYYIKNSKEHIEYYYPEGSARYVTITGMSIYSNEIRDLTTNEETILLNFLNTYMKREHQLNVDNNDSLEVDDSTIDELMIKVKNAYFRNYNFQDLWFTKAPGSGADESERDYHLVAYLYDNITKDKNKIKQLFELSPFFKSKDYKHLNKWQKQDYRYFNYLYTKIKESK